ncbi:MAG: alkaline shock response membrane anchor protein AmaP [Candidatus Dormibacteraeota bacterium]|uniref:Alkaline shock response membrane anchor protein AmaP n=1 Tax=Candidatus Amunia macphersoniae TaxID=3127014 RepID=A0A934KE70_9BACT|nr:alkaline shock response membrane anchor protein AmaP [Candidatus Dormibacteraeota bacterium]
MSTPNRPARLNRTVLALLGVILLMAGAFGLAFGLDLLHGVLPALDPSARVVPAGATAAVWVPYVATGAAIVIGLLCLRWLIAQALRRPTTSTWRLPVDSGHGTTRLDTDHAADAAAADIAGYPGVAKATATLTGPRQQPTLHLVVHTETGAAIAPLRERITTEALPRLRQALELDTLPTDLLLRLDTSDARIRAR